MAEITNVSTTGTTNVIVADLYAMEKFCNEVLTPETKNISNQIQAMIQRLDSITVSREGFDDTFTQVFRNFKNQLQSADDDLVSINRKLIAKIEKITKDYDFASTKVAEAFQELYKLNPAEFTQYERNDSKWGGNTANLLDYLEK